MGPGGGSRPSDENKKAVDFLMYIDRPSSLENHKATQPTFSVGPLLAFQRTPFKWHFAACPLFGQSAYQKINFLISQPKHLLRVLKRTLSM